jgi:hypothetical protein
MCDEKREIDRETQVVEIAPGEENKPVDVYILPMGIDPFPEWSKEEEIVWN